MNKQKEIRSIASYSYSMFKYFLLVFFFVLSCLILVWSYQRDINFSKRVVENQVGILLSALESQRVLSNFQFIGNTIWKLDLVKEVSMFDADCNLLVAIPLSSQNEFHKCEGYKSNIKDRRVWLQFSNKFVGIGFVSMALDYSKVNISYTSIIQIFIFLLFTFIIGVVFFRFYASRKIKNIINYYVENIINLERDRRKLSDTELERNCPLELLPIKRAFFRTVKSIHEKNAKLLEQKALEVYGETARQVSHDIRSPLTALKMAVKDISSLPEATKLMILGATERINDIANNLLNLNSKDKNVNKPDCLKPTRCDEMMLVSILDSIVSEKRLQFRDNLRLRIIFDIKPQMYGIFCDLNTSDFKTIMSNIINNAIEALIDDHVNIEVSLIEKENSAFISIADNGKGIPARIIDKLGKKGETHGKKGGNGLGLFHAKNTIERWGGRFSIYSELNKGTQVVLEVPTCEKPMWFTEKLILKKNILILDDDNSVHKLWDNRFSEVDTSDTNIFHFSNSSNLFKWLDRNLNNDYLLLCDYELFNEKLNGLDIIQKIDNVENSILVTSRFENQELLSDCEKLGFGLIPKSMVPLVPLSFEQPINKKIICKNVYIEDDEYLRMGWIRIAKEKGIILDVYKSPSDFKKTGINYPTDTYFYIDSNFNNDIEKGEELAQELYKRGYEKLILVTGYSPEVFSSISWIKEVRDKNPPW